MSTQNQNLINHIVLVLDASISMGIHSGEVVKVADAEIAHLAQRSKDLDQETRVTIYTFGGYDREFRCIYYDKDVLRLPSLANEYLASHGATAVVDATIMAIEELRQTATLHGDHAFLAYVLTDGEDNHSTRRSQLRPVIDNLPENWSLGVLVPNQKGVFEAKGFGFPAGNISVWNTSSSDGFREAGSTIRAATDSFMTNRALGVRGTRTLFQLNAPAPQQMAQAINQGVVQEMHPGQFRLLDVDYPEQIAPFVERKLNRPYRIGEAYYQVTKSEKVQPQKGVAIMDKKTHKLYSGVHARQLLGLPDYEVRVSPSFSQQYIIFIQSTSVNRNLLASTQLLIMS